MPFTVYMLKNGGTPRETSAFRASKLVEHPGQTSVPDMADP